MEIEKPSKVKQNISDEERQRRRERMLELRRKLAETKEKAKEVATTGKKRPKKEKPAPPPKEEVSDTDSDVSSESEEEDKFIPPPRPLAKKTKPTEKKQLKKKVSIKYYGKVSQSEIDYDNQLLNQIHNNDNEMKVKKKSIKSKPVKPTDEVIPEENEVKTIPVVDEKATRVDRALKELFG